MISFNCIIQERAVESALWGELASRLADIAAAVFGGSAEDAAVEFTVIPHGYGFRGGEVSTTSLVRGLIPPGCAQEVRVDLMRRICAMWCDVTGCTVDELVVSARDRPAPAA
jgi:hypothetical protein